MTTAQVLSSNGILRPEDVIELAALAGLELAAAATLLQKESAGGKNVYGHDAVDTGGFYTKGGPVNKSNYTKYKSHRKSLGAQGVGPCQLTLPAFQDLADSRGGCFVWRHNAFTGFGILSGHISAHGVHDGFRRYNGSGTAAKKYADDAIDKLAAWRERLDGLPSMITPSGRPVLKFGDSGALVVRVQRFTNKTFPLYSNLDLTPKRYGPKTAKVIAEFQKRAGVSGQGVDPAGRSIGPRTWAALEFFGFR